MIFLSCFYSFIIHYIFYFAIYILHFVKNIFDKTAMGLRFRMELPKEPQE